MEDQQNYGKGYGSNWKKWLWIYVVIAIVLYGGIYLYYANKNSNSSDTGQNNSIY